MYMSKTVAFQKNLQNKLTNKGGFADSKRQKERQSYFMLAPSIIGFFVFTIYPIAWVFRHSFYEYDGVTETFIGLENFIRAFTRDTSFWASIGNTIIIAYGKLIIELPLALIVALVLSSNTIKIKKIFSLGFYLPRVTGSAVNCLIFAFLFATVNGTVNEGLMSLGFLSAPHNWFGDKWSAMSVIILQSLWSGFAANVLYFMAGVQNVPEDILEAASIDGAGKLKSFFYVTLPMLAPVVRVVLMLAMVSGMKIMNEVMLLTNGGPAGSTDVVMLKIYKLFYMNDSITVPQYGYASALGMITTFVIGILTCLYLTASKKADSVY